MVTGIYEVCVLYGDDVLMTSQTDLVPFVPRENDIILDGSSRFKVYEIRLKYLPQGMRISVYVKKIKKIRT